MPVNTVRVPMAAMVIRSRLMVSRITSSSTSRLATADTGSRNTQAVTASTRISLVNAVIFMPWHLLSAGFFTQVFRTVRHYIEQSAEPGQDGCFRPHSPIGPLPVEQIPGFPS